MVTASCRRPFQFSFESAFTGTLDITFPFDFTVGFTYNYLGASSYLATGLTKGLKGLARELQKRVILRAAVAPPKFDVSTLDDWIRAIG